MEIVEKLSALKKKLTLQKHDKEAKTGYLTSPIEDYFACLNIDSKKLEKLLEKDLANWNENLKMTEKAMEGMKERLAIFLSQQERAMADLLNPAQFLSGSFEKYEICKLPLVGDQVGPE